MNELAFTEKSSNILGENEGKFDDFIYTASVNKNFSLKPIWKKLIRLLI